MNSRGVWLILLFILISLFYFIFHFIVPNLNDINNNYEMNNLKEDVHGEKIVISSYDELIKITNLNSKYILIIGKKDCSYCDMYLPNAEELSYDYGFDFLYIDIKNFTSEDYRSFINSDIVIPGKCTRDGKNKYLREGFGTPLTLFYKNNRINDCIRGYIEKDLFYSKIDENYYIKKKLKLS